MQAEARPQPIVVQPATGLAPLRIVLFGMPDAGKSSLLGALVQAAQIQDRVLQGRLVDASLGLAELQLRLYEDRQKETRDEIVAYPIIYEPYSGSPRIDAVIYDCDGRVANELLSLRKPLVPGAKSGALADAVFNADALILTIDASATNEQVETDFREFVRFLKLLEAYRSHDRSVGGLPIYLALNKCDLLARGSITRKEWQARIEARREQVHERFARYLASNAGAADSLLAFGSIELHVTATAVKRPALAETAAHPREPLGVAELFRDCLMSANAYRQRNLSANRQLKWIIAGVGGFVALAASVAILLLATGGPVEQPVALIERVEQLQTRDKPLPDRLSYDVLQRRYDELMALRNDSGFINLPEDKKDFVRSRIDELVTYQEFREQLSHIPYPEIAKSLTALKTIEEALSTEGQGAVPAQYAIEWDKTQAVLERQQSIDEIQVLRDRVEKLDVYYTSLKNLSNDLLGGRDRRDPKSAKREFYPRWKEDADAVFELEKNPPFPEGPGIPGVAYDFVETKDARKQWLGTKDEPGPRQKLIVMRDLATALGIVGEPAAAVLDFPSSSPTADLHRLISSRMEGLRQTFPDFNKWSLELLPNPLRMELRAKLDRSRDQLTQYGQQMILAQLRRDRPAGMDTPQDWNKIGDWLKSPALGDFRELAAFVARLLDPTADDPVAATAAFLQKPNFEIQIKSLTLTVPNNLPQGPFVPGEDLVVFLRPQGGTADRITLSFRIDRGATVEGVREKEYRYKLTGNASVLTYKPLDEFGADLNLKKGDRVWQLIWSDSRTATFAFESLRRVPLLSVAGSTERGTPAVGVTLAIDGVFPDVPKLIPDLRNEKK